MPEISPVGQASVGAANGVSTHAKAHLNGRHDPDVARSTDRVELSNHARFVERLRQMPDVRNELVTSIKQAIDSGTYETESKLETALDRLVNELRDE